MEVIVDEILDYFKDNLPLPFSSPAYYVLHYPIDISLPDGRKKRNRSMNSLADWICENEILLSDQMMYWHMRRPLPYSDYLVCGTPDGFLCEFELHRWPYPGLTRQKPGSLWLRAVYPENMEPLMRERLMHTFQKNAESSSSARWKEHEAFWCWKTKITR
ncbi:MAG: hypothetical protein OXF60_06405 [Gammaproteobacteria bacterium]|nr:hypothetical protein [Gammaproteobacteria bacterium]